MSASVVDLPDYARHSGVVPAYSSIPPDDEHRIWPAATRPASWVKRSKTGSLALELFGQSPTDHLPVYGRRSVIRGVVAVQKRDTVSSVDIKVEGHLRLLEVGGNGHSTSKISAQQLTLWSKEDSSICPSSLDFAFTLPESYEKEGIRYPLPPTYQVHLSGVPGFRADVTYTITVDITKTKGSLFGNHTIVSTPLNYTPRLRPARPQPPSMSSSQFFEAAVRGTDENWEVIENTMQSRSHLTTPIQIKLFIPTGRVFSSQHSIPFKLFIRGSALSLATFLPCSPTAYSPGSRHPESRKGLTRLYVVRQISVDVRNMQAIRENVKTDIFKVVPVGEATFRRLGHGADWAAWEGEVALDQVTVGSVGSFKAGGLWVRDCLILSIVPPNPVNSALVELRSLTPIRIVTESHASTAESHPDEWTDRDEKYGGDVV